MLVAWYGLVVARVHGGQRPTATTLARLGVIPLLTALLASTNGQHGLLWRSGGGAGIWLWVHGAYALAVVLAGWVALLRGGRPVETWHRDLYGTLVASGLAIGLANVMNRWLTKGWGLALTDLVVAGCGGLLLWTIFPPRPASLLPLAQETAGGHESDAMLALDSHDRVLDANAPALLLLAEHGVWQAVGRPVRHVLTGPLAPLATVGTDGAVTLAFDGGTRIIQSRELSLASSAGPGCVRVLLLQDVSATHAANEGRPDARESRHNGAAALHHCSDSPGEQAPYS